MLLAIASYPAVALGPAVLLYHVVASYHAVLRAVIYLELIYGIHFRGYLHGVVEESGRPRAHSLDGSSI